ncbi:hypothetical protein HDU93_003931, partial [Gonapodya sp. JEL0774]
MPPSNLIMPATWESIGGEFSRFPDIFSGVVAPNVWGDMKKFVGECGRVVEEGRRELTQAKVDIQSKLSALDLKIPSDKKPVEAAKPPTPAAALLDSLKAHQKEESILSSTTLLPTLNQLIVLTKQNLGEALTVLETVDKEAIRGESERVDAIVGLRDATAKVKIRLAASEKKVKDLDRRWEVVEGLGVEKWTEEKLRAIIPSLDPKRTPPPAPSREKVEEIKRERDSLARRAEELQKTCEEKLKEMTQVGVDVDKAPPSVDLHLHMQARRRQLKLLEETVATIRKEKETVLKKVQEVADAVKTQTGRLTEYEEELKVINSFKSGLDKYASWREEAQAEVDKCLKLREDSVHLVLQCLRHPTKPKPPGNSGGFGAAFKGILSRASSVANLLTNPTANERDPLLLAMMSKPLDAATGRFFTELGHVRSKGKESAGGPGELKRSDTDIISLAIRGLPDKEDDFLLLMKKDMEDGSGSPVSIKRVIFETAPTSEVESPLEVTVMQAAAPAPQASKPKSSIA